MPVASFIRQLVADRISAPHRDAQERTLAILAGARSVISRGWLQGGWYVLESQDGRRRFVGAGALTPRRYGSVVQACLVGAVVEAGRWYSPEQGASGPAIDALWRTLVDAEGERAVPERRTAAPAVRRVQVRDLTRWNDEPQRSRDDVLRLVDLAVARVLAAQPPQPSGTEDGPKSLAPVEPAESAADEGRVPTRV
jgi:hypothetical protein